MADQSQGKHRGVASESCRRKVTSDSAKPQRTELEHLHCQASTTTAVPSSSPCGACKFLRRKCISGCIFAPHFGSDQGAARFAAVHKVFGASNVSKLLMHIPLNRRHDAVVTVCYEAQARLSDPVYGCVTTILALQQQVASLETELATVQTQLLNSRFALANALQSSHQQNQEHLQLQQNVALLQPAYSNNSSAASANLINLSTFTSNFHDRALCSHTMEPLLLSRPLQDLDEEEEDSQVPHVFTTDRYT